MSAFVQNLKTFRTIIIETKVQKQKLKKKKQFINVTNGLHWKLRLINELNDEYSNLSTKQIELWNKENAPNENEWKKNQRNAATSIIIVINIEWGILSDAKI